jgi:hypothetical protein
VQVRLSDLRAVCDRLFAHLDEMGIEAVEIDNNYYWDIPSGARFNVDEPPVVEQIGQLTDDWADLRKLLDGTAEPIAYNFVDLAAILRAVGETVVR